MQMILRFTCPYPIQQTWIPCNRSVPGLSCLSDIHLWMSANKLKLNTDKTEVLVVGTECKLSSFNVTAISMAGCRVLVSDKPISNLGVSFDRNLSMCNQVHRVVRSSYFHLRSIGLARKILTVTASKQLVQALVISHLDYCNSLLTGIPTSLMSRHEMVQHRAARLIFRSSGNQSVTVLIKDLHWLPVTAHVFVLVYKCRKGLGPGHLTSMLSAYIPVRGLRSASYGLLFEPRLRLKTVGDRAFSVAGSCEWNRLPGEIRESDSWCVQEKAEDPPVQGFLWSLVCFSRFHLSPCSVYT